MKITVYSKDNCAQCTAIKRKLTQLELEYIEKNVEHDEAARRHVLDLGFMTAPVTIIEFDGDDRRGVTFAGYQPTVLEQLKKDLAAGPLSTWPPEPEVDREAFEKAPTA